jgi:hypothetical protein
MLRNLSNQFFNILLASVDIFNCTMIRANTTEKQIMVQNDDLQKTANIIQQLNPILPETFKFDC